MLKASLITSTMYSVQMQFTYRTQSATCFG